MLRYCFIFICIGYVVGCHSVAKYRTIDRGGVDSSRLDAFISEWLGTPYRYGGMSKKGIDCSGFVVLLMQEVYGPRLNHFLEEDNQYGRYKKKTFR